MFAAACLHVFVVSRKFSGGLARADATSPDSALPARPAPQVSVETSPQPVPSVREQVLHGDVLDLGVRHLEEVLLAETSTPDPNVVVAVIDPLMREDLIARTLETLRRIGLQQADVPILIVAPENLAATLRKDFSRQPNILVESASRAFELSEGAGVLRLDVVEELLSERGLLGRRVVLVRRQGLGLLESALGLISHLVQILFDEQFNLTIERRIDETQRSKSHA